MDVEPVDTATLRNWIGKQQQSEDQITPGLAQRFCATLDHAGPPPDALLGIHWALAPAAVPMAEIGTDGHPAGGGFLPPMPLPRRMWAGGELVFTGRLRVGDVVRRKSSIKDIVWKNGKSGPLGIVTVCHDYSTAAGTVLQERQDIVYRAMPSGPEPIAAPAERGPKAEWQAPVPADPVLLYRYSALTFNAHRIHYDRRYAVEAEHYPGLVVQGPLQATLLLRFAATLHGAAPRKFAFRSTAPIFDGGQMTLNAAKSNDGLLLWTADQAGHAAMTAQAWW